MQLSCSARSMPVIGSFLLVCQMVWVFAFGALCLAERPGFLLVASDLIRGSLHSTTGPGIIIEMLANSRCLVGATRKSLIRHEAGSPTQTGALTRRFSGGSFQPALLRMPPHQGQRQERGVRGISNQPATQSDSGIALKISRHPHRETFEHGAGARTKALGCLLTRGF